MNAPASHLPHGGRDMADVATSCGAVAVGATSAYNMMTGVGASISRQLATLHGLENTAAALRAEQAECARSSLEAKQVAERSARNIRSGAQLMGASAAEFAAVAELVVRLGEQVAGLTDAMTEARRSTAEIDELARTSKVLALNATIEATRAGTAGRAFGVVAEEVKRLASDTRAINDRVATRIDHLQRQATEIAAELADAAARAETARREFGAVDRVMEEVVGLSGLVAQQADEIVRSTGTVRNGVDEVRESLAGFIRDARENGAVLVEAERLVTDLEVRANRMFDALVAAGFAPDDAAYVERATAARDEVQRIIESALARGEIQLADVLDRDYREIPGSSPPRYDTRFNGFADRHIRPILDRVTGADPRIEGAVCSDVNGYLPTHVSARSRDPRPGHAEWNDHWCRHRRILFDPATARAAQSEAPFTMAVYQISRGSDRTIIKSVYVPLRFGGRRWGNFEIGYHSL